MAAIFIQIATNFINDAIDFAKGADSDSRIGPQRVTQSGLLSHKQVMQAAVFFLLLALICGIPLVLKGGLPIVLIGLISLALAYGYTGGPFPLAYLGLGDLFVILFFGLIAVGGTFFLQTGSFSSVVIFPGLQVGFLATVLIAINNLRDAPEDAKVGKKTLAVRFGQTFAKAEITVLCYAPYFLGIAYEERGWTWAAYGPLITVPLVSRLVRGIWSSSASYSMNRFLVLAAAVHLLFGIALSIGLWMGARV
jgi:1,4-dihydroxy-2-naphthoate octaprenyltransferase